MPNGAGKIISTNFDAYVGQFKDGRASGQGTYHFSRMNLCSDLIKYEGNLANDFFDGFGLLYTKDLKVIKSDFKEGMLSEKYVEQTYPEGEPLTKSYQGQIIVDKNDYNIDIKFEKKGDLKLKDGRTYTGEFSNGELKGSGTCYFPDHDENYLRFEGNIENWLFNGKGTLYQKNGDQYSGDFKNNKFHGDGKYNYSEASKEWKSYEGSFARGKENGTGAVTFKNGSKKLGTFKNGTLVNWI